MSLTSSSKKKIKTSSHEKEEEQQQQQDDDDHEHDWERIQQYLHDCPHVSPGHPLIEAAIRAVEKEYARLQRDRKLQSKFSTTLPPQHPHHDGKTPLRTSTGTTMTSTVLAVDPMEDGLVVVENRPRSPLPPPTAEEEMEWQDVPDKEKEDHEQAATTSSSSSSSFLGKTLAKAAIDKMAEHQQKVKSPVAAIAVALHAALRSETLGFACTGIPEPETMTGFAPPVRALAPHQFLPMSWDSSSTNLALRYRKAGTGALVLLVQGEDEPTKMISVRLQPASSKEPSPQKMEFALDEHVNLDSWNAAVKVTPYVSPALHYKSLALLMTKFCQTFDLGTVQEEDEDTSVCATQPTPYVDNTVMQDIPRSEFIPARATAPSSVGGHRMPDFAGRVPSTLGEAFPGILPQRVGGDFSGDLTPAGIVDPRCLPDGGLMGGNLMGPNHPLFQGGPGGIRGGIPLGGPGSMQPRFDPIYPDVIDFPGGGQAPAGRLHRPRPLGDPNPDHLRPPNSFNGNMFS
jgi:PI31 proteasome regulator N-terminal